jgi:SRSO17 transposase
LHHFIADGVWDATPLESELLNQADRLVGGNDAVLVIDDTAMPKKGDRSVLFPLLMQCSHAAILFQYIASIR